jgi:hypothetical protein
MKISQADYDALAAKGYLPQLDKMAGKPIGMNKTEAAFAAWELEPQVRDGKIKRWWFEPMRLKVAEPDPTTRRASFYVPDFLVWWADGTLEFVEIKGFMRDDARDKFKVAQSIYPGFRFRMVRKVKGTFETIMGTPSSKN